MPRDKANSGLFLQVEVMQSGISMASAVFPGRKRGALAITADSRSPLSLPHYPIPNNRMEFLRFVGGTPTLLVGHRWEGFCTSEGNLINIGRTEKKVQTIALHRNDYASIACDDLRIMVRVLTTRPARREPAVSPGRIWRSSFLKPYFPTIEDRRLSILAAVFALVVVGGAALRLARHTPYKPQNLDDLEDSYVLPFVNPGSLELAPEALQTNLDRDAQVRSVVRLYEAHSAMFTGLPAKYPELLLPTSETFWQQAHAENRRKISGLVEEQLERDSLQRSRPGAAVLAIPAVLGETVNGKKLRIIDKVKIMHAGFRENLDRKRRFIEEFPTDPEYSYEDYKSGGGGRNSRVKDYLGKVRVFGRSTNEEQMYASAARLAKLARERQTRWQNSVGPVDSPVGIPAGAGYASFANTGDFLLMDDRLRHIRGVPAAAAQGPARTGPVADKKGSIEAKVVEGFIKQHKFQLQLCYELALRRNEGLGGVMEWAWRVDPRGAITDVALVNSTIADRRMVQCIRNKISRWRFPRPADGSVEISFPFEFSPTKG